MRAQFHHQPLFGISFVLAFRGDEAVISFPFNLIGDPLHTRPTFWLCSRNIWLRGGRSNLRIQSSRPAMIVPKMPYSVLAPELHNNDKGT